MKPEEFQNEQNDPDLIPGIYNYCDCWCERCSQSSYCLVYKTEMQKRFNRTATETRYSEKAEFWDYLKSTLEKTYSLLHDLARDMGVDPDELEKKGIKTGQSKEEAEEKHPVVENAESYFSSAREWLLDNADMLYKKKQFIKYGSREENQDEEKDIYLLINDLYDIINWYHTIILVKAKRAVGGLERDDKRDEVQNDMNGSAKVMRLCIDRSLFAWKEIERHLEGQDELIAANRSQLVTLKEKSDQYFPHADEFIRPGFDA